MYVVLTAFVDAQDENHVYYTGDQFPRPGAEVSEERLEELSSNRNRCGVPMIVKEEPTEGLSEVKEDARENEAGVDPSTMSEAKEKAEKRYRRNARTGS